MAFDFNRAINEGYRAGKPVIVLSDEGKVLHGRKELEACVRSGTSVSSAVIRGIKAEEWAKSDWPETLGGSQTGLLWARQASRISHSRARRDGGIAEAPDWEPPAFMGIQCGRKSPKGRRVRFHVELYVCSIGKRLRLSRAHHSY